MAKLKIGADFLIPCDDMRIGFQERYGLTFRQIELAAKGGIHGVWVTEHHFSNYGYTPNPLMLLAGVAREFPHLYLGTAILVLPLWNPVRLAEDIAVLDVMSGGKVIVGIGRGYQPYEFVGLGQNIACNRGQSEEATEILLAAWTQDDFTYAGRFYNFNEPVTVLPRPVQQPHPPVWCATTSPESIRYAARMGFGFMLATSFTPAEVAEQREFIEAALQEAGRPTAGYELSKNTYVFCSTDPQQVEAAIADALWQQRTAKFLRDGNKPVGGKNLSLPTEGEPADDVLRARMIVGNPDECLSQIEALERAGLTYITGVFEYPRLPFASQLASLELFTKEVMPAVTGSRA
ncbi:MAG: LLM class flavin-dependent oxidoreductase [Chloroflexi bacterium]|nr:LLM class flavin-dependent oxidoreductase [Chloroflexota bacterium]